MAPAIASIGHPPRVVASVFKNVRNKTAPAGSKISLKRARTGAREMVLLKEPFASSPTTRRALAPARLVPSPRSKFCSHPEIRPRDATNIRPSYTLQPLRFTMT